MTSIARNEASFGGDLEKVGRLPLVDLDRFFPSTESFNQRITQIHDKAESLQRVYAGTIAQLDAGQLAKFLEQAEEVAALNFSTRQFITLLGAKHLDASNQAARAQLDLQTATKPFQMVMEEFNLLDEGHIYTLSRHPALSVYKANLEKEAKTRRYEPARHGVKVTELLEIQSIEIAEERTFANLKWEIGERVSATPEQSQIIRQQENTAHVEDFATLLSNSHRRLADMQKCVGMEKPYGMICLSHETSIGEIDALMDSIRDARQTRHDFWKWRAEREGVETLDYHTPKLADTDKSIYPWTFAHELVTGANRHFSPELEKIVASFYDDWRIDAAPMPRRALTNFTIAGSHYFEPIVFISYFGKNSDIVTKAHELTHGANTVLSVQHQNFWNSRANLLISETIALFGEGLLYDERLRRTKTEEEKTALKAEKLENRLSKTFYFAAVNDFEIAVHNLAKRGKVSGDAIGNMWRDTHLAYAGDAVHIAQEDKHDWIDCDTIFKVSFYMPSYSFASLMSDHLRADYKKRGDAFVHNFMELLQAGSSKPTLELLKPFGVERLDRSFWQNCVNILKADTEQFIADNPNLSSRSLKPHMPQKTL